MYLMTSENVIVT